MKHRRHYCNPLGVQAADPFVVRFSGVYHLYATNDCEIDAGVSVWTSKDLVHWRRRGHALRKTRDSWGQARFWSAEVVYHDDAYFMFYTTSPDRERRTYQNMQIGVAKGDNPLGPFEELASPLFDGGGPDEAIDQNTIVGPDGRIYFNWTRVTGDRNEVQCVRLAEDLCSFDGEPVTLLKPEDPWECRAWQGHVVLEGSHMLCYKGLYYLIYCANHFLDEKYAVGYAVGEHPLGPFVRAPENPILSGRGRLKGVGNGCPILSPDGSEWFLLYHTHAHTGRVHPRQLALDRMRFVPQEGSPDRLEILGPSEQPQPLPAGAEPGRARLNDDFEDPLNDDQWTIVNEDAEGWDRVEGRLQLTLGPEPARTGWDDLKNIFVGATPEADFHARATVELVDAEVGDTAFLCVFQDYRRHASIHLTKVADGYALETRFQEDEAFHDLLSQPVAANHVELHVERIGERISFRARPLGGKSIDMSGTVLDMPLPSMGIGGWSGEAIGRGRAFISEALVEAL